ncbi:MAG: lipase family protein [Alphaproteobacteria bacterium]|nr:lipase family protein [Alphaproteobacteria bacterium]
MNKLRKFFLRSAGMTMILKGITGVQAIPHFADTGTDSLETTKRQLHPPTKIHFEDRVEIVTALNKKGEELLNEQKKRDHLRKSIEGEKTALNDIAKKAGFTSSSIEVLKDKNCFINTITQKDAKEFGNLSALVYDIDQKKTLRKASTKATKLDRDISTKLGEIAMLEDKFSSIASSLDKFDAFKKSLKVFGIELDKKASVSAVQLALNSRINTIEEEVRQLQDQKSVENTEYLDEARTVFGRNLHGMKYEVEGVFHRNNGEFSGAAAYDKDNHKLVLSFAGSKSWGDWTKNLFGWNRKLSKSHGLLSNISFHGGFGSHFDDNADSFFSFMKSWLTKFKAENPTQTLKLVGTGHSLGGSLGEIFSAAAKEMAENLGIKVDIGIMTFGAPNTVNANTLDNYTKVLGGAGNVIRFAHSYDPVPKLVFWKTAPGAVTVKGDTSLLYDVNGTMELPVRVNPHSSEDYYHASETVFQEWEKNLTPLKSHLTRITQLESQEKASEAAIGSIASEAHQLLADLANQDKLSAAVFQDEYESYVRKQQEELEAIKADFRALGRSLQARIKESKPVSAQDMQHFEEQFKDFERRLKEKNDFILSLQKEKAWEAYARKISADFAALRERIATDSLFLSSILG